jgi:auxin efflux carrier (AEC)
VEVFSLIEIIALILLLAGVGIALRVTKVLKPDDARPLNDIIIYAALPALVFRAVHGADLRPELLLMAVVAWAALLVGFAIAWGACRLLKLPDATAAGFMITAALGNTGYLGYPLALSLFGDEGLVRAIFYDIFGTVFAVLTIGLLIAGRLGDAGGRRVNVLKEVVTFPGVIALALALALRPVVIPDLVAQALEALGNLVVPLIMISLGVSLKAGTIRERYAALGGVTVVKLLLVPVVALGVGTVVLGDAEAVRLGVMQAGMPSMMLSLVFGIRYRLDVDFIASAILVTTVGAIFTVPLFQILIG